jgi:hypothetical protein
MRRRRPKWAVFAGADGLAGTRGRGRAMSEGVDAAGPGLGSGGEGGFGQRVVRGDEGGGALRAGAGGALCGRRRGGMGKGNKVTRPEIILFGEADAAGVGFGQADEGLQGEDAGGVEGLVGRAILAGVRGFAGRGRVRGALGKAVGVTGEGAAEGEEPDEGLLGAGFRRIDGAAGGGGVAFAQPCDGGAEEAQKPGADGSQRGGALKGGGGGDHGTENEHSGRRFQGKKSGDAEKSSGRRWLRRRACPLESIGPRETFSVLPPVLKPRCRVGRDPVARSR